MLNEEIEKKNQCHKKKCEGKKNLNQPELAQLTFHPQHENGIKKIRLLKERLSKKKLKLKNKTLKKKTQA